MSKKKYKGIDLFCGIGGFRLAMEDNEVECVFSSDNDKFAQETYHANFGEIPEGDIKKIEAKDIPPFDILAAGFPCQPFSIAGYRKGFEDDRGNMFFQIMRLVDEMADNKNNFSNLSKLREEAAGLISFAENVKNCW